MLIENLKIAKTSLINKIKEAKATNLLPSNFVNPTIYKDNQLKFSNITNSSINCIASFYDETEKLHDPDISNKYYTFRYDGIPITFRDPQYLLPNRKSIRTGKGTEMIVVNSLMEKLSSLAIQEDKHFFSNSKALVDFSTYDTSTSDLICSLASIVCDVFITRNNIKDESQSCYFSPDHYGKSGNIGDISFSNCNIPAISCKKDSNEIKSFRVDRDPDRYISIMFGSDPSLLEWQSFKTEYKNCLDKEISKEKFNITGKYQKIELMSNVSKLLYKTFNNLIDNTSFIAYFNEFILGHKFRYSLFKFNTKLKNPYVEFYPKGIPKVAKLIGVKTQDRLNQPFVSKIILQFEDIYLNIVEISVRLKSDHQPGFKIAIEKYQIIDEKYSDIERYSL